MRCIRSPVLPRFELYSLHYDETPGQQIPILTAHSSGRSMSYMPNVSMSRSHKTARLGNSWLQYPSHKWGQHSPEGILRLPFSPTSYLPPDWFEWPPWNTPHLGLKRHRVIISAIPLFKLGSAVEPGEAEPQSFYSRGNFNCS